MTSFLRRRGSSTPAVLALSGGLVLGGIALGACSSGSSGAGEATGSTGSSTRGSTSSGHASSGGSSNGGSSSGHATNEGGSADASSLDATSPDAGSDAASDGAAPSCSDETADGGIPNDLACTGLYSDWATKTIAADAMPYTPALVFWSDGADKTRWLYLPPGAQIDTTDMDNWVFPAGTKIWKQFVVGGQIIETRLIWKNTGDVGDWTYLDYRWSADGSSAVRLDSGETNVNGSTYEIPATSMCANCHAGRPDAVLGVDLLGLGASGASGVTLASLAQANRFTDAPPSTSVAIPEDATGKAAAALAWLHVNCGTSCHNASGNAQADYTGLRLKLLASQMDPPDGAAPSVSKLDPYVTSVNVEAHDVFNATTFLRIAPGDAGASLVPILSLTRSPDAGFEPMPPIVSHIPDTTGVAAVTAWINALHPDAGP